MYSIKRPLSEKELLEEAENILAESDSSNDNKDFDSDDSVKDPGFQDCPSSSSEDSSSEEVNDNPAKNPTSGEK